MISYYLRFSAIFLFVFISNTLPSYAESEAALSIDDFLVGANLRSVAISPDDKYLAGVWRQDEQYCVIVRDLGIKGFPITGQICGDIIRSFYVKWASKDRLLIQLAIPYDLKEVRNDKDDTNFDIRNYAYYPRIISVNPELKDIVYLMDDRKSRTKGNIRFANIQNMLIHEDNYILMTIPSYPSRRKTVFKVNVKTGESEALVSGRRSTVSFVTNNVGEILYRQDYLKYSRKRIILKHLGNDKWKKVKTLIAKFNGSDNIEYENVNVNDQQWVVYRRPNTLTGFYELVKSKGFLDKEEVVVSLPNQDVLKPLPFRYSQIISGYATEKDVIRNHYFDQDTQLFYDNIAKNFPEQNFNIQSYNKKRRYVIVKSYSPNNPGIYFIYDNELEKLSALQTAYKRLNYELLSAPILIDYPTRDGKLLRAYGLLPPDYNETKKYPMVIMPHGGPRARNKASYDDFAQFISTRGYIVIQPNFRGSTGYGLKFEQAGFKQWGGLMQDDLTDAVNFMIDQGYADKNKICIVGASYGGYAALMGTIKTPDLFQCAVSINGVTHLEKQIEFDLEEAGKFEDELRKYTDVTIGHLENDAELLAKNSPVLNVDKINKPILLIGSLKDDIVPHDQTYMMLNELEDKQKKHEYLRLKDADHHVFTYIDDTEEIYKKVESFLAEHLNKEEVSPIN